MTDLTTEQKAAARPLPIFKPQLRQAIREGRKTETRRLVKHDSFDRSDTTGFDFHFRKDSCWQDVTRQEFLAKCPYGKPGDIAYMREPLWTDSRIEYIKDEPNCIIFQDQPEHCRNHRGELQRVEYPTGTATGGPDLVSREDSQKTLEASPHWLTGKWTSMTMPKWAARTFVRITDIKVEQLHDIRDAGAIAEGLPSPQRNAALLGKSEGWQHWDDSHRWTASAKVAFMWLWDSIHGLESWAANPWVWVISWEPVE